MLCFPEVLFVALLLLFGSAAGAQSSTSIGSWSHDLVYPPSRSKHVAVAWARDGVFVSGGRGNDGAYLSDNWFYNVTTRLWQRVSVYGKERPAMELCAFAAFGSDVYIYGGININLDVPVSSDLFVVSMTDFSQRILTATGAVPGPRQSGCAVTVDDGFVLLFGSAATMIEKHYHFIASSSSWNLLPSLMPAPPGRELPCCARFNATTVVCFGGVIVEDLSDLWLLDTVTWQWTNLTSNAPIFNVTWPYARNGHQCFADEATKSFVVAGGFNQKLYSGGLADLRDVWAFDMSSRSWRMTDNGNSIPPFDTVPTVDTGSHALVFGGWAPTEMLNSIYEFKRPNFVWSVVQPQTYWPLPRYLNCFTPVGSSFHSFFGTDGTNLVSDSWWTYTPTRVQRWKRVDLPLAPRAGATCTLHSTVVVVLFGSFDSSLATVSSTVELVYPYAEPPFSRVVTSVDGTTPPPRSEHGAAHRGQFVYIFGGRSSTGAALSDVWRFDVALLQWKQLTVTGPSPSGRIGMGFATVSSGFLMISGYDGTYYPPDRWILRVVAGSTSAAWNKLSTTTADPLLEAYQLRWRSVSFSTSESSSSAFSFSGEPVPFDYRQNLLFVNSSVAMGLNVGPDVATYGACGGGVIGRVFHSFGGLSTLPRLRLQTTPSATLQTFTLTSICSGNASDAYGNCSVCGDGSTGQSCDPCPAGRYFDLPSRSCVACPAGTFGIDTGLIGQSSCLPCDAGTFSATSGATTCTPCSNGSQCSIGSTSQVNASSQMLSVVTNSTSNSQPVDWATDPAMAQVNKALLVFGIVSVVVVTILLIAAKCREHIRRRIALRNEVCVERLRRMFDIICLGSDELQREHLYGLCRAIAVPTSEVPSEIHLFTMSLYFDTSGNNTVRFDEFLDLLVYLMEKENFKVDWVLLGVDEENAKAMENELREVQRQWLEDEGKRPYKARPSRPFSLASFDIFGDAHGAEDEVSFMRSRKTAAGGACTILFAVACIIILVLFLATFFYDNTIQTKSSVPSILLPIDVGSITSTVTVTLTLINVPSISACNCTDATIQGLGATFVEVGRTCTFDASTNVCVLRTTLGGFNVAVPQASISFTFTNSAMSSRGVGISVVASASAQDLTRQSSIQAGIVIDPSAKTVLRGLSAPTVFALNFYPTVTIVNGVNSPGYHIDVTGSSLGALSSNIDFSTSVGLQVVLSITTVLSSSLIVDFEDSMTWLNLLSQISGAISGVSPILLLFMALVESLISAVEGCIVGEGSQAQRDEKVRRKTVRFSTQFGIDDDNRCSKALPNVSEENRVMLELVFDGVPYRAAKRIAGLLNHYNSNHEEPTHNGEQQPAPSQRMDTF